ncbi:MAG: hypothetical protein FWG12_03810 [Holophagaceae bacterium]|nr:hypothetical protein [Holophagaceae bacterium]
MNDRIFTLALALAPLALTVGCEKKPTREEIIAEYEATRVEQERLDRIEKEHNELKEQLAQSAENEQHKADLLKAKENELAAARKKLEQAQQIAKEVEQTKQVAPAPEPDASNPSERNRPERARPTVIAIAKGTELFVTLSKELTTDSHKAGDAWEGSLAQDISVGGQMVWTAGTPVNGLVSQSTPTGRLANGEGVLAIKLTEIGGASIDGGIFVVTGDAKGARNAKVIAGTAALGALVGILTDKKNQADHALGGAAIGAAAGTAVAAATANTAIKIPSASPISFVVPADEQIVRRSR